MNGMFQVEFRSITHKLQQTVGRIYGPGCDATLGDSRCTVDISALGVSGTVTSVTSNQVFGDSGIANPNAYFNYGVLTWTSGSNNGATMEVRNYTVGAFTLFLAMPYDIEVSDTFTVTPGCDKTNTTCKDVFSNLVNFRGFPDVIGQDQLLQIGV